MIDQRRRSGCTVPWCGMAPICCSRTRSLVERSTERRCAGANRTPGPGRCGDVDGWLGSAPRLAASSTQQGARRLPCRSENWRSTPQSTSIMLIGSEEVSRATASRSRASWKLPPENTGPLEQACNSAARDRSAPRRSPSITRVPMAHAFRRSVPTRAQRSQRALWRSSPFSDAPDKWTSFRLACRRSALWRSPWRGQPWSAWLVGGRHGACRHRQAAS